MPAQLHGNHNDGEQPRQDGGFEHDERAVVQSDGQAAKHDNQNKAEPLGGFQLAVLPIGVSGLGDACYHSDGGGEDDVFGGGVGGEKQDDGDEIAECFHVAAGMLKGGYHNRK